MNWFRKLLISEEQKTIIEIKNLLKEREKIAGKNPVKTIGGVAGIFYDG